MTINVNHKKTSVSDAANLLELIDAMQIPEKGVALAVNNTVIPKTEWQSFILEENMNVTLIRATQGG